MQHAKRNSHAELIRALRASESRFRAIVEKSGDGIMVVGVDGRIRFLNPAAERLLNSRHGELIGEHFGIPTDPGEFTEIELLSRGERRRVAEMRVVKTEWQDEPAYLAALIDVTEHKRREEEAREAVRCRDRFLATLSHELRNPLAAISSAAYVLRKQTDVDSRSARAQSVIERESRHMARLLDDLLDVCRVSQGKVELRREDLELGQAAVDAAQIVAPRLEQAKLKFDCELPNRTLFVSADPVRLQQVIVNLLNNAAKYTPAGGRVLLKIGQEDGQAVIRVGDTGAGIPVDKLEAIFDPFVQVPISHDNANPGLGVGLSLVRSFVELHGGTVKAFSDGVNRGSEFVVRLPMIAPPESIENDKMPKPVEKTGELRILLVEDNAGAREMLKALLELDGHEAETASDGRRGVEMIEFQKPDVALIDIGLPGFDGYQVARRIRANPANAGTYLIALTGYGQPEDRRNALESGFDEHLVKPLNPDDLNRILAGLKNRTAKA